jgi:N-sulfoglucosamine sulfohydrolase
VLNGKSKNFREVIFAEHTARGINRGPEAYGTRAVRDSRYKLIVNLASELPYPFALDLIKSPTWISATAAGAKLYGRRTIENFLHRPRLELYNLERDPDEVTNLADSPAHAALQADLLAQLKEFQTTTKDPWFHYWSYR